MRESDVKLWLINQTTTFLSNSPLVTLTTPSEHTDTAEEHDDAVYPFVGLQSLASVPQTAGLGSGDVFVESINYGSDGVVDSIDFYREVTYRGELIPTTDGDSLLRDDLSDDLSDYFARIARKGEYPTDVASFDVGDSSPSDRPDDFVRASSVGVEVTYKRLERDTDITAADTVNVDVTATDDPSTASGDTAFDETF